MTDNCVRYNGAQSFYGTEARALRRAADAEIDAYLQAKSGRYVPARPSERRARSLAASTLVYFLIG